MSSARFGTAITCVDGRVQLPLITWLKDAYGLDYVDMITEPGADKVLADGWPSDTAPLRSKAFRLVAIHRSAVLAIAGHHDCAANPVTREEHRAQIRAGVRLFRSWQLPVDVVGLWVNERWEIEVVDPAPPP